MLPRKHRITKKLWNEIYKKGVLYTTPFFSVRIVDIPESPSFKAACVVSKKVAAKATERNMLRRRVYAALTPLLHELQVGKAMLFFVKKHTEGEASVEKYNQSIHEVCAKARLFITK